MSWNNQFWSSFHKHHPWMTLIYSLICSIQLLILLPTIIICHSIDIIEKYNFVTSLLILTHNEQLLHLSQIMYESLHISLFLILIAKFWIIYYDYNFSLANVNKVWQSSINISVSENNFWLKHRKTFGNLRIIFWAIFVVNFVIFVVYLVMQIFGDNKHIIIFQSYGFDLCLFARLIVKIIIIIIASIVMWSILSKTRKVFDTYDIKQNGKKLFICFVVFLTISTINQCIFISQLQFDINDTEYSNKYINQSKSELVILYFCMIFEFVINILYFMVMALLQVTKYLCVFLVCNDFGCENVFAK